LDDAGAKPFGLEAVDIARVESGLIIIALDYMPGEGSPYDVSLDRFVKAGTECVAAEALAAIAAAPPRRLKTLEIQGDEVPEAGTPVTRDGQEVGTLTSPVASPRFGTIGLAVVATDAATDGTSVEVGGTAATIAPLNLYDPAKQKPRG
jgi:aminomethyltransferase